MWQIFFSSLLVLLLHQTSLSFSATKERPEFQKPPNGSSVNETKHFVDNNTIISCRTARGVDRYPNIELVFLNGKRIKSQEIQGSSIGDYSRQSSFTNINIKKDGSSITIMCKAYYGAYASNSADNMDSYAITLCFEKNCDKAKDAGSSSEALFISIIAVAIIIFVAMGAVSSTIFKKNWLKNSQDPETEFQKLLPRTYDFASNEVEVEVTLVLGQGEYGFVYTGKLKREESEVAVACKTLQHSNVKQKIIFLKEMKILKKIKEKMGHENVVKFIGSYAKDIENFEIYMILEYCPKIDLATYIKSNKPFYRRFPSPPQNNGYQAAEEKMFVEDLIRWAKQIASGMKYLRENNVLHCDLAIRNILLAEVGGKLVAKINDFGLSKNFENMSECGNYYYFNDFVGRPFKSLAPEVFTRKKLSEYSDIWAFGVLLWELFSLGDTPYGRMNINEVQQYLQDNKRLGQPAEANLYVHSIMMGCWEKVERSRTKFHVLQQLFADLEEKVQANPSSYNDKKDDELEVEDEQVRLQQPHEVVLQIADDDDDNMDLMDSSDDGNDDVDDDVVVEDENNHLENQGLLRNPFIFVPVI